MKKKFIFLFSSATVFSLLLVLAIQPEAFASKLSHHIAANSGNKNHVGNSNSHASVNNDNSVHILQNGGGGNRPSLGGNRGRNNNNNHKNNNDKKIVRKRIDKHITKKNILTINTPQQPVVTEAPEPEVVSPPSEENPPVVIDQPVPQEEESPTPQVVNNNENTNENTNINEIHPVQTVYVDRPVQEVASVQTEEHVVYPVQSVTRTPETGAGDIALMSLPSMAGLGFFLRRKFGI